jgi:hypothetical protein
MQKLENFIKSLLSDNGEIWEFTNRDVVATCNVTMGRKSDKGTV